MNLADVTNINIPEGEVIKIEVGGVVIWEQVEEVAYKNWVSFSINADGSIYNNGLGYKDGYRVRSGGLEDAMANASCTGFIPVNGGDVIRFKGWTFTYITSANAINVADASFNNLGQTTSQNYSYGILSSTYSDYGWSSVVEETEGVWKWVVPPEASGIAYIRVSGSNQNGISGTDMIVTVNEEIA